MSSSRIVVLCLVAGIVAQTSKPAESTIEPATTAIAAAAATQAVLSPVSNVKGAAFDRFIQVWLENTDYSAAAGDPNQQFFAKQGITLTNYWAVTHPSEPNYAAAVGGDYFGMENDDFNRIPANIVGISCVRRMLNL
jgi:acid phosphatase